MSGEYTSGLIRKHYLHYHDMNFGSAPLPRTKEEIDRQTFYDSESKRCSLCGETMIIYSNFFFTQ